MARLHAFSKGHAVPPLCQVVAGLLPRRPVHVDEPGTCREYLIWRIGPIAEHLAPDAKVRPSPPTGRTRLGLGMPPPAEKRPIDEADVTQPAHPDCHVPVVGRNRRYVKAPHLFG